MGRQRDRDFRLAASGNQAREFEVLGGQRLAVAIALHQPVQTQAGLRLHGHVGAGQALAIGRVHQITVELEIEISAFAPIAGGQRRVHALGDFRQLPAHPLAIPFGDHAARGGDLQGGADEEHICQIRLRQLGDEYAAIGRAAQQALLDQSLHGFPKRAAADTVPEGNPRLVELRARRENPREDLFAQLGGDAARERRPRQSLSLNGGVLHRRRLHAEQRGKSAEIGNLPVAVRRILGTMPPTHQYPLPHVQIVGAHQIVSQAGGHMQKRLRAPTNGVEHVLERL